MKCDASECKTRETFFPMSIAKQIKHQALYICGLRFKKRNSQNVNIKIKGGIVTLCSIHV